MHKQLYILLIIGLLALSPSLRALDGQGNVVFKSPTAKDTGWKSFEILTGGDALGPLAKEGFDWNNSDFTSWDGLGAYRLDADTLRVFINHENGPNSTFSRVDLDIANLRAWGHAGIADNSFSNQTLPPGPVVESVSLGWLEVDGLNPIDNPCSSNVWLANTFGPGRGFADDVYLVGEETFDSTGNFWFMELSTRKLYKCPDLGGGSWENATPIDTGRTDTIALLLADDSGSNPAGTAPIKLYVGLKQANGNFRERNGLVGGTVYYWNPDGTANTNGTTQPGGLFEPGAGTFITGSWTTSSSGAALLSKLEDVHVNTQLSSPGYGREVIIASQGEGLLLLDATQLTFEAGTLASSQDSDVRLIYKAGDISGFSAMDNLVWSPNGRVYVNEDDGEGDIWQVDVNSLRFDDTPSAAQVTDIVDADGSRLGESAGIIDISVMIGECPGTFFLTTGHASSISDNQLAMLVAPQATISPHGTLIVTQNDAGNSSSSVDGELLDITALKVGYDSAESSRGDFAIHTFPDYTNSLGILLASVAENGRDNSADGDPAGTFYPTCAVEDYPDGYSISTNIDGGEFNVNVAFVFLKYTDWLAGRATNLSGLNGGANDSLEGSDGINLGTEFIDNGNGTSTLDLTGLGSSSADGILLVNGGKNEDNFALSRANGDGTFTIFCHDNGINGTTYEQDPVNFAYLPYNAVGTKGLLAMGRLANTVGSSTVVDGPSQSLVLETPSAGVWRISLPGYSPDNATLIVSSEGGGTNNVDNAVSYEWDATSGKWVIHSRDLPGYGLQAGSGTEIMVNFAIFRHVKDGGEIYVDHSAVGSDDGRSWVNAFDDLQDAVTFAQTGEKIFVAEGSYFPDEGNGQVSNSRLSTYSLAPGVSLYGGFPAGGAALEGRDPAANITILDGDINLSGDSSGNAYNVLTVSGPGLQLLPAVTALLNPPVLIDGFTIQNGNADGTTDDIQSGGGIYASGVILFVNNCVVRENTADFEGGGIHATNGTALTVARSIISSNQLLATSSQGAGISFSGSSLSISQSRIENNVTPLIAGGLYLISGSVEITDSSITGNRADDSGGIWIQTDVAIRNTTIAGNIAGNDFLTGGFSILDGSVMLEHVTIFGNIGGSGGGGIYMQAPAAVTIKDSLIAGNAAVGSINDDVFYANGSLIVQGTNLIGNNSSVSTQFPAGPLVGTSANPLDPRLLPLGDYGGPTLSAPPRPESPAVDAFGVSSIQLDQRGVARADGTGDIGAVEYLPAVVTNASDSGSGSLREAVFLPFASTVTFDPGFFDGEVGDEIILASDILLDESVVIDGGGIAEGVILSGGGTTRHFSVDSTGDLTLRNLTLTNGNGTGLVNGEDLRGGAIYNLGKLTLEACTLFDNSAPADGGAIFNKDSNGIDLFNCTIDGNSCGGEGGAIYTLRADSTLIACTITNNQCGSSRRGGGILIRSGSTTRLSNCLIEDNIPGTGGGPNILTENSSDLLVFGALLMDDYAGSTVSPSGIIILGEGNLLPLGYLGGPTPVRLPLPGSDALDAGAGTGTGVDQRGVVRGTPFDIGAVEFEDSELTALWETDDDNDGRPFGVEIAYGTNPLLADQPPASATGFFINFFGQPNFSFPRDPDAAASTIWVVERSSPGLDSFQEVYRIDGPSGLETATSDISSSYSGPADPDVTITDENPPSRAFYRFRALVAP